jgi:hypothetical protein
MVNKILLALAALVVVAAVVFFALREPAESPKSAAPAAPPPAAAPPPVAKAEPSATAPAEPAPVPRKSAAPKKAESAPATPAAPAAATLATLVLDSDVAGASVFVNREYVGTTPLRLEKLEPGSKQLKLTADGYEGIERTVDLSAGENPVTMRFKEVRLNKRIAVNHKHGVGGGCEGTLVATLDGLAYETTNKGDAFNLPYAQVETFAVDYIEKNLRVKQKGGKTWNFTDKAAANADALFVFQRDVEAARKKLAEGYAAVK